MFARLACATGWTWEYIDDHVTLPRLKGFAEYWNVSPPVNELAAAWLKAQGASAPPPIEDWAPDLLELIPRRG